MSPARAASRAVVCIVIFGVVIAHAAQRRPVAVIDLTESKAGEDLARELGNVLNNHQELRPVDDPAMPPNLMGQIVDEDADRVVTARERKQTAETELQDREFARAASTAEAGQGGLRYATPTPAVVKLYAELAFVVGHARFRERKPELAETAFRLAHELDPGFTPNAAMMLPEVATAFEAAKAATPEMGKIAVAGTGQIFIDGKEVDLVSRTRATFDVPAGTHVVWLVGPERDPRGTQVTVVARQKVEATIPDAVTTKAAKVRRARLALKAAPDSTARAGAIKHLATLLGVHDALVLTTVNSKTVVQTWRDRAPGFSALRELRPKDKPADLLVPLAPPPKRLVLPPKVDEPGKIHIVEKPWYKRRRYVALGGTLLTSLVVGAILAYRSWDRQIELFENPSFTTPSVEAR
jgi:hypothetical protein